MKKRSKTAAKIKGFFIFILIIAALCAVFYFGYYQFQLPVDNYAVIFTKLHGWLPDTVMPGTFRIEWEGLIPINLRMEKFVLTPVTKHVDLEGKLPSAEIYSMYLEGKPDFSYTYSFDISYILKAESLPELVSEYFLRSDTIESVMQEFESEFLTSAVTFIRQKAEDASYLSRINYNYRLMEKDLLDFLSSEYSYLEFTGFSPAEIVFPDLSLYLEGRRQYFEMEKYHNDIQKAALKNTANRMIGESAKLELLEKYGAVFEKYPNLINYYSIFKADGEELLPSIDLPDLEESVSPQAPEL